jgi:PEP-CTERM motif
MTVNGKLEVNGGGISGSPIGSLTVSGVANVTGGVTGESVIVNPRGTLTADSYAGFNTDVSGTLSTDLYMQSGGTSVIESGGIVSATTFRAPIGEVRVFGVADVTGGFTNSGALVLVNPGGTITAGSYSQSSQSLTDVLGTISTASYKQSGGDTIIEGGGTISATTFKATGGTVTVNGTLDPTAVEIGSGATLQGTGKIVGNVSMGGTMIPGGLGAPGTITIFGNYEQTGNGVLREFISSSSSGLLNVNGDVALDSDSILSIALLNGFNPIGDTFTIMDYASLVGQFSNGTSFWGDGFLWDVNYGANQIKISAVRSPEPSSLLLLCVGFAALALCAQRKMAKTHLLG